MKFYYVYWALLPIICNSNAFAKVENMNLRVATFNVSMEATNYVGEPEAIKGNELSMLLRDGNHAQIKNIAEIIQHVRPDVILLNEFDYSQQSSQDLKRFITNYLNVTQTGEAAIDYPYFFAAPVNTGLDSGHDLDGDGTATGTKGDAFGFGFYPGHYGMAVLSKYPIQINKVRTFQRFLWKDMPNNLLLDMKTESDENFYTNEVQQILRLSSKSHWDVPIKVGEQTLHILASHPTPPVFDGPEDRNGKRNHDEIRFWTDYISSAEQSAYIYDDNGKKGGFSGKHFIVAGDLNASPDEGNAINASIATLTSHERVNDKTAPTSDGARLHTPTNENAPQHTAGWRMRVDYVLPSATLNVNDSGVFWPITSDPLYRLIKDRESSSDHRLVWIDVAFPE